MKRAFGVVMAAALLTWPLSGRAVNDASVGDADLAWDRGDYVSALTSYLKALPTGSPSEIEAIALQTGELYTTTELTPDGSAPRFSPDGRRIVYETGTGLQRTVRLASIDAPATVTLELPGFGAAFSPDGSQIIYLKAQSTPALEQDQAAVDRAPPAERAQRLAVLNQTVSEGAIVAVRDMASGVERTVDTAGLRKSSAIIAADAAVLFAGAAGSDPLQIYAVAGTSPPRQLTAGPGDKTLQEVNATGTAAIVTIRGASGGRGASATASPTFGLLSVPDGRWSVIPGASASFSADGRSFTFVVRSANEWHLMAADTARPDAPVLVRRGPERLDAPALSRDGSRVVYQAMPREDWELFVINRDGTGERRITHEIQHDVLPRFLTADRLLGTIGEPRHRRSYIYDLDTPGGGAVERRRLFHNNTIRTIAPEYGWVPSPDGTRILISAERDGDTVSPARGVYLVDLSRTVTRDELRARLESNLSAEEALIAKGKRLFGPIAAAVRNVVREASVSSVYAHEKALFDFDSKHITQPGNKLASAYLFDAYKSWGYEPQYQWFEPRNALAGQTANVVATLRGTVNPEIVYLVSSHYDSVATGPGADDDSSGTAALLETARILARHPQPATIVFASLTGEESGLLGSREFVRRAVAAKVRVAGALNNDMVGWANDNRLDNTIRYSNPGIRDVQHAAAMQFTQLITYDALYYKGTDAASYYEAYGDIVGGIGSYPVLGNPHYHQPHDVLETINHQLVTEVAKTTAATVMLLASSPSRVSELKIDRYQDGTAALSWKPSPETGVTGYVVAYGPAANPEAHQITVKTATATVKAAPGAIVSVKAVNAKGLEGWDWARVAIP
jgi:hypothetical protein